MLGEGLALGAAACWAFSVVLFARGLGLPRADNGAKRSEAVSPLGLNLFKNVVALALLALTLVALGVPIDFTRSPGDWARLCASGLLGIALADTLVFMALRRLGAGLLAVVDCCYAPTIVVLGVFVLDERLSAGFAAGAVLVVGGVLAAVTERSDSLPPNGGGAPGPRPDQQSGGSGRGSRAGIALGIAGIVAMAIGVMLAKPVLERSALVEVTLVRMAAGVGGQVVWMALVPAGREALGALRPAPVWRTMLPAAVLGSYVSMLLWLGGFKWASASVAAVLNQLSAVFTLLLARIVLGEPLSARRAAGAGAAVLGACLVLVW